MPTVKILTKGQIIIPADIRKKYRIVSGTELQIMESGGLICLVPPVEDPVKAVQRLASFEPVPLA
jgi:AbrB family looped-hinge helix DNA binding protein